jgi:hypothetical protein
MMISKVLGLRRGRLVPRQKANAAGLAVMMITVLVVGAFFLFYSGASTVLAVVEPCGALPSQVQASATSTPSNPVAYFAGGTGVHDMHIFRSPSGATGDRMVVQFSNNFQVYNMSNGAVAGSFTVPFQANINFALDGQGNIYIAENPNNNQKIHKYNLAGQDQWSGGKPAGAIVDGGMFSFKAADGSHKIGLVIRGQSGSRLFNTDGSYTGDSAMIGIKFTQDIASGKVFSSDGSYIRTYANDTANTLVGEFGNVPQNVNEGGPFHFYQPGAAVLAPNGQVYIPDGGHGIIAASADGLYKGQINIEALNYPSETSPAEIYNGRLYFANGGRFNTVSKISSIALTDLDQLINFPKGPREEGKPTSPVLGFGAGLSSTATANYYKPGETPSVRVDFAPWWSRVSGVTGQYTVRERREILAGQPATVQTFNLPSGGVTSVNLALPVAKPGHYQVDARLIKNGAAISADCLFYSVGAPGNNLDFAALPAGADFGGGQPSRSLVLSKQLGLKLVRGTVSAHDWTRLLPGGASSTAPMVFPADIEDKLRSAADQARATGVTFHVQLGEDGIQRELVNNGQWEARVRELVNHFKADIKYWEAWNEPNITGFSNPVDYVNQVLIPFNRAVKAADSTAKVVGGSPVGLDIGYFDGIGKAGGFGHMDIIGIHPYTGHGRSYEEEGLIRGFEAFNNMKAAHGVASKEVWDTESAWWSDGQGSMYATADRVARKLALNNQFKVSKWSYFIPESGFGEWDLSWSMIYFANKANHFVKPAALSAMVYNTQAGSRLFLKMLPTGVPHTYAVLYGPAPGGNNNLVMLWSDDMKTDVKVSMPDVTATSTKLTDLMGLESSLTINSGAISMSIDGSPQYLVIPSMSEPTITAGETFGANLALKSGGATAAASSQNTPNDTGDKVIDGTSDAAMNGEPFGQPWTPAWASSLADTAPSVTISLPAKQSINRVVVSGHSISSVVSGLRNYDVQVARSDGSWETVGSVVDEFHRRRRVVSFSPRETDKIKVVVKTINYGGLAGGVKPWWLKTTDVWPALIYEVEAYAPGSGTPPPPPPPGTIANAGFEAPDIPNGQFTANPGGATWTFETYPYAHAGIAENGSGMTAGNPPAPEGTQVAYMQMNGALSQDINLEAGKSYTVTFLAAQRQNYQTGGFHDFDVFWGGVGVGTFRPAGTSYGSHTSQAFTPTSTGSYKLKFQGKNSAGGDNSSFIDGVRLNVSTSGDTIPPTVSLTAPADGASLSGPVELAANATDNTGVTKVEFYDGTTLLGSDSASPYTYSWNTTTASNGSHTLSAKAYDAAGNTATSQSVTVNIQNATTKTGDLNNDGQVNIFDLSILLSNYNTTNANADINKDGTVNIFDLSILLSNYGT